MDKNAGPWNDYQSASPAAGPWDDFKSAPPEKPRTRGLVEALNDNVIEFANAAAGGVASAANFVSPGNKLSSFIDENIIKSGEQKQSDVVKTAKQTLSSGLDSATGITDELGAVGSYVINNPLLAASQAAGSFAVPGGVVKGGGKVAQALGAGAKGIETAGRAGGIAAGAAMAGGDAAGTAYDLSKKAGATEDQAIAAGRQASVIPAAVGGLTGAFGAEKLLAGGKGFTGNALTRGLKSGLSEAGQEGFEEGVTQYEGQRAAMPYDATIDPTKGVAGAAGMGAIMGFGPGAVLGAAQGNPIAAAASSPNLDQPAPQGIDDSIQPVAQPGVEPIVVSPAGVAQKPSESMGIDPAAGPLSRAAASAVDAVPQVVPAQEIPAQTAVSEEKSDGVKKNAIEPAVSEQNSMAPVEQAVAPVPPVAEKAPVAAPVPMEQRSLDELRQAFRGAQDPSIRKTIAAEIRKRRESMPDPLTQQSLIPEQPANVAPSAKTFQTSQKEPQAPAAQPAALGSPLTDSGASILGRGTDPLQSIIESRNNAAQEQANTPVAPPAASPEVDGPTQSVGTADQAGIAPVARKAVSNKLKEARNARQASTPVTTPADAASSKPVQEAAQPDAGALTRPDGWRKNAIKARKVAKSIGLDPADKRLAQIVAEIDAKDGGQPEQQPRTREQAIRDAWSKEPRTIGKWTPLSVDANGRKADMLVNQKRAGGIKGAGALTVVNIRMGKMLKDMDAEPIATTYRLTADDRLVEEGIPSVATPGQIAAWKSAGFKLDDKAANVQDAPSQPTRTENQAAPVEARAAEGGNAAEAGGVPAEGDKAGVQQGGVKPGDGKESVEPAGEWRSLIGGNEVRTNKDGLTVRKHGRVVHIRGATSITADKKAKELALAEIRELHHIGVKADKNDQYSEATIWLNGSGELVAKKGGKKPIGLVAKILKIAATGAGGVQADGVAVSQPVSQPEAEPLAVEKPQAQENQFAEYDAIAQQYGYEVRPDGSIGSDGKFPGVTMSVKKGRLRVEGKNGNLLASYSPKPESLGKFLEAFWYAEKKPAKPQAQEQADDDAFMVVAEKPAKAKKRGISAGQYEANLSAWANGAPKVLSDKADDYAFKSGQSVLLESFHGTARGDRVGTKFLKKRATSGPMSFFTSDAELAASYAQGKQDTSLANEDTNYANWFKYQPKGQRSPVPLDRAWYSMDEATKQRILERMPDIRTDDDGNVIYEAGGGDIGSYQWNLKQTQKGFDKRGNPLAAAIETWLMSGALFNEEQDFMKVLKLAGVPVSGITYDNPGESFPFVYKTWLKMNSPLVTSDIPTRVEQALKAAALKDRSRAAPSGADTWDKNTRTLRDWVKEYFEPASGDNKFVWTSIPDKVTEVLRAEGFDGIIDWSGKGGGATHPVYIPFEQNQVKSAIGNSGKFDPNKDDIMNFGSKDRGQGTPTDRAVMDMAGEGRDANDILKLIAGTSKSPFYRQLANRLIATGANPAVSLGADMGGGEGFKFLAKYSRKNHEVTLSEAAADRAEQIFLHETTHAATLMALDRGGQYADQMKTLYEQVKKNKLADGYGMKNIGEFVAEAFTNPDFQKQLKDIPVLGRSAWQRFVTMVRRILGMDVGAQNALEQALELGVGVMRENVALRKARSFRAEDGPAFAGRATNQGMNEDELSEALDAITRDDLEDDEVFSRSFPAVDDVEYVKKIGASMTGSGGIHVYVKGDGVRDFGPHEFFFYDNDDELVGFARLTKSDKQASINMIAFKEEARGNGFAKAFYEYLLNEVGVSIKSDKEITEGTSAVYKSLARKYSASADADGRVILSKPDTDGAYFGIADAVEQIKAFDVKTAPKNTWAHYRGMAMQALGRRQIVDLYGDEFGPHLTQYDYLVQKMDAEKNENGAAADQLAQDWSNLKDEKALAELMHDATLAQVDPAKPMPEGDGKGREAFTALHNRKVYKELFARYEKLSPEAKKAYQQARDMYVDHYRAVQQAIKERIERSEMSEGQKRKMMADLDEKLFKELKGVYFPLARFGQYVIVVKDANGEVKNVTRAETVKEAETVRKELQKAFPAHMGNTVGKVLKQAEFNAGRDAVGKGFMADLMGALDKKGVDDELRDTVAQLYLSSLPDLSWAKHGIHRKGTPGFSQDARRAFAQNMFHGARYLAKLRYSDQLQDELTAMQDYVKAYEGVEEYDSIQGQQVVDEMVKRHEILMNPKSSPVSTALTSFGFLFHMGLSPASAMVNLTQTALVAYPQMGAKWGFDKAGAALLKASDETVRAKNDLASTLKGDELAAFNRATKDGTIDVTMAHDLAGIAQGEDQGVMWKIRPVMRWASFMFHHAEKFNRQATFLAAYRLAKAANPSMNEDSLYEEAKKATYDGHFDYSAANRARVMQGNWQRVILLFKQYAQSMLYTLSRNAYQSIKALDPKERSQARKTLAGILAGHAAAAGVLGLPIVGPLLTVASWIGGDDDEPWDAEVAMQNAMADMLGPKAAEVIARGFSRLTPFDISGRVALNKLILPDVQEGLEGKQWAESAMAAALGPVAGIGVNMARGVQKITEGDYMRGMEDMLPTALRGPLKAVRYNIEGAQDKTGITITDDVSLAGEAGQFLGLSPSQVRRDTERRSAIYGYDKALLERRSVLMRMFAEARISGDNEGEQEIQKEIQGFNQKNPNRRITPQNLAQSIRNRRKRVEEAQQGVYLPSKRRDALDSVTF